MAERYWPRSLVGIDENGLGPRLGPLVVTGVLARPTTAVAARMAAGPPPKSLKARIGDSKRLVGFGHSALGEAWARVFLRSRGREVTSPAELLSALLLGEEKNYRENCGEHASLCWGVEGEEFASRKSLVESVERDFAFLQDAGVILEEIRIIPVCVRRLNVLQDTGRNRLDINLGTMEQLVLAHREFAGGEITAFCGKVGGTNSYQTRFTRVPTEMCIPLCQGREASAYRIEGLGEVVFAADAEEKCILVALASLVGKWVRDLLMNRIVGRLRQEDPSLPLASGYQDEVTDQFVKDSSGVRKNMGLPGECFERK